MPRRRDPNRPRRPRPTAPHPADDRTDPRGFGVLLVCYLEAAATKYSAETMKGRTKVLRHFVAWCAERDLTRPADITRAHLEHYRRWLHHQRKAPAAKGEERQPLGVRTQAVYLNAVRLFFRWLAKQHLILFNPASEIELPRTAKSLPAHVLSAAETEQVLAKVDLSTPMGLRDRAILETLYSTGIRRSELAQVKPGDLDRERGTLRIRHGKGRKERVVPIGARAIAWVERYVRELRPRLVVGGSGLVDSEMSCPSNGGAAGSTNPEPPTPNLFLCRDGRAITPAALAQRVQEFLNRAGFHRYGSCHLFRHTAATLMFEGGADIRYIQAILGHADLSTTEIYTRVSIQKLKEVHTNTHPGARLRRRNDENDPPAHDQAEEAVADRLDRNADKDEPEDE